MLTYQVRQRVLKLEGDQTLPFPASGSVQFHFSPLQPFGVEAGGDIPQYRMKRYL